MAKSPSLKVIVKIYALPNAWPTADGGREVRIEADGRIITAAIRPKLWGRLIEGTKAWPSWVAKLEGRMGRLTAEGFELIDPDLQVFDAKGKR